MQAHPAVFLGMRAGASMHVHLRVVRWAEMPVWVWVCSGKYTGSVSEWDMCTCGSVSLSLCTHMCSGMSPHVCTGKGMCSGLCVPSGTQTDLQV